MTTISPSAVVARPRSVGRDVVVFGVGLVAGQALSAATTPLFTRALGPANFGAFDVLSVLITLLSTLLLAGMDQALVATYFAHGSGGRRALVSSGFTFVLLSGLVGCGVVLLAREQVAHLILGGAGRQSLIVAALVGVPPAIAFAYTVEVLRLDRRAGPFAVTGVLRAVVGSAAGAWLVLVAHQGVRGLLWGLAAGSLAAVLYNTVVVRRLLGLRLTKPDVALMVPVGLPLIPTGIAFWSLMVVDRLVLVHFVSLRQVGFYALANKIAVLLMWVVYGFRVGWTAWILEHHERDPADATRERARALIQAVAGAAVLAAVLGGLSSELTRIGGGSEFQPAARLVPLLLIGLLLFSSTVVVQSAMLIRRRTGLMATHTVVAAVVNLAGCVVLVPLWGNYGAAIATCLGFAYLAAGFYLSAQQIDRVPYDVRRAVVVGALALPYLALGQVMIGPLWLSVVAKLTVVALLPVGLWRAGVVQIGSGGRR